MKLVFLPAEKPLGEAARKAILKGVYRGIDFEEQSIFFYDKAASVASSKKLRSALLFLFGQEAQHLQMLSDLRVKLVSNWVPARVEVSGLKKMRIFPGKGKTIGGLAAKDCGIMQKALGAEIRTRDYYMKIAKNTFDANISRFFRRMQAFEQGHCDLIKRVQKHLEA